MKKIIYFLPAIPFTILLVYFAFLTYRNYKVNQKGTLKYKGNQIIDFN